MDITKRLDELRRSDSFLTMYTQAMSLLSQSGILEVMREMSRCKPASTETGNYLYEQLTNAGFSMGYASALDDLMYFRDKYLLPIVRENPEPEYGAFTIAVAKGDLTEEEVNAIRAGQPIDYSTKPVRKPAKPTGGG